MSHISQIIDAAVDLGTAGRYVVLAKAGVSNVRPSTILGKRIRDQEGFSPIAAPTRYLTPNQVMGGFHTADWSVPTHMQLTTSMMDMEAAYRDAARRVVTSSANINVGRGLVGGGTFRPGVYRWNTDINIGSDIIIRGIGDGERFIFQTSGNVIVSSGVKVLLDGTAKAANIVWQVAGNLDVGVDSHVQGTFLVGNHAAFQVGSSATGRIFCEKTASVARLIACSGTHTR
jgi:hypothetical protein